MKCANEARIVAIPMVGSHCKYHISILINEFQKFLFFIIVVGGILILPLTITEPSNYFGLWKGIFYGGVRVIEFIHAAAITILRIFDGGVDDVSQLEGSFVA